MSDAPEQERSFSVNQLGEDNVLSLLTAGIGLTFAGARTIDNMLAAYQVKPRGLDRGSVVSLERSKTYGMINLVIPATAELPACTVQVALDDNLFIYPW